MEQSFVKNIGQCAAMVIDTIPPQVPYVLWYDISRSPYYVRYYNVVTGEWQPVAVGISELANVGDTILEGAQIDANGNWLNRGVIYKGVENERALLRTLKAGSDDLDISTPNYDNVITIKTARFIRISTGVAVLKEDSGDKVGSTVTTNDNWRIDDVTTNSNGDPEPFTFGTNKWCDFDIISYGAAGPSTPFRWIGNLDGQTPAGELLFPRTGSAIFEFTTTLANDTGSLRKGRIRVMREGMIAHTSTREFLYIDIIQTYSGAVPSIHIYPDEHEFHSQGLIYNLSVVCIATTGYSYDGWKILGIDCLPTDITIPIPPEIASYTFPSWVTAIAFKPQGYIQVSCAPHARRMEADIYVVHPNMQLWDVCRLYKDGSHVWLESEVTQGSPDYNPNAYLVYLDQNDSFFERRQVYIEDVAQTAP